MRKKILLVDDAETVLSVERMILSRDYDTVVARDGVEALDKAVAECPDLILLDVVMPKMNGFETCMQIRLKEETRNIPVIIVTTRGEAHNIETAYRVGCNDYVTKPISSIELLSKIRDHIGE